MCNKKKAGGNLLWYRFHGYNLILNSQREIGFNAVFFSHCYCCFKAISPEIV